MRTSLSKPKVVIGHPRLGFGGSESVVMWLIEALKHNFEVTVVTTDGWNLEALNLFYGTSVKENEVTVRIAPLPLLWRNFSAAAVRGACYQRFARQIAAEYDVRISAYNMTDWGLPALHFLADFSWNKELREQLDPPSPGFAYRQSVLRRLYLKLAAVYQQPSGRIVLMDDPIIANSNWSAELLKRHCGVDCAAVMYPPVWEEFPSVPWEEKELAFVMIGRIAPEKQIERTIEILEAVRRRGHAINLHLCGQIENNLYGRRIMRLCRDRSNWIVIEGHVTGVNKRDILTHCRFGIQMRNAEPFGISVAEMIKAGAIVFAPGDGGQAEILNCTDLLFRNSDDAANKICATLDSPEQQNVLLTHLAARTSAFNSDGFVECVNVALRALAVIPSQEQRMKSNAYV